MSTSTGRPTTVGGGRRPQNLHHSAQLEERADEYYTDAASPYVAASPSPVRSGTRLDRTVPVKQVSARQEFLQLPGRW